MSLTVIYVHGFNSSASSIKAQQVASYFQEKQLFAQGYELLIPELHYAPRLAIAQVDECVQRAKNDQVLLIGSSLGGYYSLWIAHQYTHCKAVLVNPAVYPYILLEELLGENENIYTGQKYCLTVEHIAQLKAIEVVDFAQTFERKGRLLLLSQCGDETLNYQEAVEKLAGITQRVTPGGNHSFVDFDQVIGDIIHFALASPKQDSINN